MNKAILIERLRKKRLRLLKAYILHVGWFTSTCASAATDVTHIAMVTSLWLALITVPPVLFFTIDVHKACRLINPAAGTFGLIPVILATIFLTPLESGIILPAKNLWLSRRILLAWDNALTLRTKRPQKYGDQSV
jgi:hypothetical protein